MIPKRPASKLIPKSEANSLLQNDPNWSEIQGMSQGTNFFRHNDGRGLLTSKISRKAEVFESATAFLEFRELVKKGGSHHILHGLLPNDGRFIERIEEYIARFTQRCAIPETLLDYTLEGLDKLEKHLRKFSDEEVATEAVFSGLIAYVGEVMRISMNGRWVMRLSDQDKATWEPWIVDSNGYGCTPIVFLWDRYIEGEKLSLYGAASVEMNTPNRILIEPKI
jgi:hypothetical protein